MNQKAAEGRYSSSEVHWWKANRSLDEIAQQLQRTVQDKQALESRLVELLEENKRLNQRCSVASSQLTGERNRLKAEILQLESQVRESKEQLQKKSGIGRQQAELAARERLIRDEFERKAQLLHIEFNKERRKLARQVEEMEQRLSGCFCQGIQEPASKRGRARTPDLLDPWGGRVAR